MAKKRRLSALSLITVLAVLALSVPLIAAAGDRLPVFVSILPQKYFVEQIGGEFVDVRVMVQPGASPAGYEPKPGQMTDLVDTRIYFAIGVPFEGAWLDRISAVNPNMEVVHTENGIPTIPMARAHDHDEDDGQSEESEGRDPHIWLSPPLVTVQAQTILASLTRIDPAHGDLYEANYRRFVSEVDALDAGFRAMFDDGRERRFMVFHPSWGYFADAYGLEQIAIEIEGKEPKSGQLMALIEHARKEGIRVIFVQPQFSAKSAELIAREIDGRVAVADPLAEDWAENLKRVAEAFKAGSR